MEYLIFINKKYASIFTFPNQDFKLYFANFC